MDIIRESFVITRKGHQCDACFRSFPKGTRMHVQVNTSDGICAFRTCETCQELLTDHSKYFEYNDLFEAGCVHEWLILEQKPEDLLYRVKMKKGCKVTYVGSPHKGYEWGIVFKDCAPDDSSISVVYSCGEDWGNFDRYTPARTFLKDIRPGWIKQNEDVASR